MIGESLKGIRPALRYPGSKSKVADLLFSKFPKDIQMFVEPFAGSASMFFKFREHFPGTTCWINDSYKPLIDFYQCLRDPIKADLLIRRLYHDHKSIGSLEDAKAHFRKIKARGLLSFQDPTRTARDLFFLNRVTFGGTIESGGFSPVQFSGRYTLSSIEKVEQATNPLIWLNTIITNFDFMTVIENCQQPDRFFLVDPPYYMPKVKPKLYGKDGRLSRFPHRKLRDALKSAKFKFLLTLQDDPIIRKAYGFANIEPLEMIYGISTDDGKSRRGKEICITNY